MSEITFLRGREARAKFGNTANSTWYDMINAGLMTPGVALGARSVAWPSHELEAIAAARIAGESDDDIRALVKQLVAARAKVFHPLAEAA